MNPVKTLQDPNVKICEKSKQMWLILTHLCDRFPKNVILRYSRGLIQLLSLPCALVLHYTVAKPNRKQSKHAATETDTLFGSGTESGTTLTSILPPF